VSANIVIWIAMLMTPVTIVVTVLVCDHCRDEPRSAPWPPETLPPPPPPIPQVVHTGKATYEKPMLALPRGES
jgi:hypothetical protein